MNNNYFNSKSTVYAIYRWYVIDGKSYRAKMAEYTAINDVTAYVYNGAFFEYEIETIQRESGYEIELDLHTGTEWVCKYAEVSS